MIKIQHIFTFENDFEAQSKGFGKALRLALDVMGEKWKSRFRARHFRMGAEKRYGYEKRDPKYLKNKHGMGGRGPLLVKTGLTRLVSTGSAVRVRISKKKGSATASVSFQAPHYVRPAGKPWRGQPDMGRELTEIAPDEMKFLAGVFERALEDELARPRKRGGARKRTKRIS